MLSMTKQLVCKLEVLQPQPSTMPFLPKNVWKYFALYVNKSLEQITVVCIFCALSATFVENKCNFLTFLLCINATFLENKCNFLTFLRQQKLALLITTINQGSKVTSEKRPVLFCSAWSFPLYCKILNENIQR